MSHANSALTPKARLKIARLIVDEHWPVARAAERYDVSWPTAKRWADRYRDAGEAGMGDRSSRPHHQPNKTSEKLKRKIVHLRWKQRLGPVQIGDKVGLPASTVHALLVRCRLNRLSHIDRVTGEPIRRYEHPYPGAMLHVDVTKFGNVPHGGGHRFVGRQQGNKNRAATPGKPRSATYEPLMGKAFVHTVIDDHSRVAYAEIPATRLHETRGTSNLQQTRGTSHSVEYAGLIIAWRKGIKGWEAQVAHVTDVDFAALHINRVEASRLRPAVHADEKNDRPMKPGTTCPHSPANSSLIHPLATPPHKICDTGSSATYQRTRLTPAERLVILPREEPSSNIER